MSLLSPLARSFAPAIKAICALIAHHAGLDRRLSPIVLIVWGRLNRTLTRLDRLIARWQAGTLRPPRPKPTTPRTPVTRTPPATKVPTEKAWLLRLIPHAGQHHGHVETIVNNAELAALVAAAPQAGRLLRPLARMFGIPLPAHLKLPPRPRKPRAPKPPRLRQTPARGFTRAQIASMSAAELRALYAPLPPHFPLPIPNLALIRRKIAAG